MLLNWRLKNVCLRGSYKFFFFRGSENLVILACLLNFKLFSYSGSSSKLLYVRKETHVITMHENE